MTNTTYPQAGKFIDPLSDWGFRHYFGSEPNKEILIEFLNDLFEGEKYIEGLEYGPTEHDGDDGDDKRVIFDLHCKGKNGEFFIIEMQRIRQEYFKDRALYYTSRLIQRQLPKGKVFNNYQLPEVYLIAVLEFQMDEREKEQYFHDIALADKSTGEIFYKKLGFKFMELPNFAKNGTQLESERDKWFYLLKHMSNMDKIPKFLDKRVFKLIFKIGEVSKLKKEERMAYESSLKAKWDTQNAFDYAIKKAQEEERSKAEAEKRKIALELKKLGVSIEDISKATGFSKEEIESFKV
ncbi:Rpn family recombination-promoting nuclease/putative transposase [Olivibacter domesticus]|uniref:Rpn family recombination-promoting nuclease/putative transposase n=1 Tax=Olivibacter domesticus TaxID=407022 RepID=A0A1H7JVB9_OLID1|nr:Rpn family recombination-promoting nuclease/putative transposase [Olivibacter domesticus]SEK78256.1 conserved hypothetical protein (putative transposase or invertase) [Olivibacter domesticus]